MSLLGTLLLLLGGIVLVIAAWGVVILSDALARQHAATKAGSLALTLIGLGAALVRPEIEWLWRLLLIVGFLLITLPVASHLLARAALREGGLTQSAQQAPRIDTQAPGNKEVGKE